MPALITHAVLTEKVFDKLFKERNKKEFFIGTLLPDIRHIKAVEREKTHFQNLSLADLEKEGSFGAGLKFHSILDRIWQEFIDKSQLLSRYPDSPRVRLSLKLTQDKLLRSRSDNWPEYIGYLDEILPAETALGIREGSVKKWHRLVQEYIGEQPDEQSLHNFDLDIPDKVIREINENIAKMETDEKVLAVLEEFEKNFESLIK